LWTDIVKPKLDSEGGDEVKKLEKCNLGPDKFSRVTIAATGKDDGEVVVVVEGDGIGKKDNLDCIAKEDEKITVEEDGKVVKLGGDEATGYVVNDGMIVVAGSDWTTVVKELVDGKGKSAKDGGALKDLLGRADTGKAIWFAGTVPAEANQMLSGMAGGGTVKDGTGSLDLSSGAALQVSLGLDSEDSAKKAKEAADLQITAMKEKGGNMVPKSVTDSAKVEADGSVLKAEVSISDEDLKGLATMAMASM
jgi:hypothetical protein